MKKVIGTVAIIIISLGLVAGALFLVRRSQVRRPMGEQEEVIQLTNELSNKGISILGLPVVQDDEITASIAGKRVVFSRDKAIVDQVRALQLILPRLKMDAVISEVDLRFNKVVLR